MRHGSPPILLVHESHAHAHDMMSFLARDTKNGYHKISGGMGELHQKLRISLSAPRYYLRHRLITK